MRGRYTFRLRDLLIAVLTIAVFFALARACFIVLENAFWRVHPKEQHIADYIRARGGAYHADRSKDYQITGVWLGNTEATDHDLEIVLTLPCLTDLDLTNSRISDASLASIFHHARIESVRLTGTRISRTTLLKHIEESDDRVFVED